MQKYVITQTQLNRLRELCQAGTQAHGDEFYEPIMATFDGLLKAQPLAQVLLIKELKGRRTGQLMDDPAYAEQMAREFVGDHNEADGCSTVPHAESRGGPHGTSFYITRGSSFGIRRAYVRPIGTEFKVELP